MTVPTARLLAVTVSVAVLVEAIGAMVQAPEVTDTGVPAVLTHWYTLTWPRMEFVTLLPMGKVPAVSPPASMLTGTAPAAVVSEEDHAA